MKFKHIKSIVSAALFLSLTTGMTSCINDLDISPIDPQMTATFDQDMYFTKLYASLGLTGQKLSEDPDIAVKDEGQSCFYRALFTNNEYGTDEMIWTWQENAGIPELTYMRWNSSHQQTEILYNRLAYNITLCNFFLDQIRKRGCYLRSATCRSPFSPFLILLLSDGHLRKSSFHRTLLQRESSSKDGLRTVRLY